MEEPLFILEKIKQEEEHQPNDVEMEDDFEDESFWQTAAESIDKVARKEEDTDMNDPVDNETPRFESLSVRDDAPSPTKSTGLKRKRVGEDVFTRDSVKQWQSSRIKAWESRYLVSYLHIICVLILNMSFLNQN